MEKKSVNFDCFFLCSQKSELTKSSRECRAASMGVGTSDLDMIYRRIWARADSRITICARPKSPSSSLYTISKSVRAQKSPRYNRFLVIYDLVINDICCVYLDTRPNFSTKFARYIRLLVITGLVIYDFYCNNSWHKQKLKTLFLSVSFLTLKQRFLLSQDLLI